jgi:hypothetical protein
MVVDRRRFDSHLDFESIVCGIDASPQSVEAVRQAIALAAGDRARYWGGVAATVH